MARQRRRLLEDERVPDRYERVCDRSSSCRWYMVRCGRDEVSRDPLLVINIVIHKNKDAC
jgi:hypothetical protein